MATVSQRKGVTVLPDHRSQVSQARALTDNRTAQLAQNPSPKPNNTGLPITQVHASSSIIQATGIASTLFTGEASGELSTDLLIKAIRSQLQLSWQGVIVTLLMAFDYKIAAPTAQGWISWAYSKLSGEFIQTIMARVSPAYTAVKAAHKVFLLLPETLQNVIIYALGRGFRKFLGTLHSVMTADTADSIADSIFASNPSAAFNNINEWLQGLSSAPTTFIYKKYYAGEAGSSANVSATDSQSDPDSSEKVAITQREQQLISLDTDILKLKLGVPKLSKKKTSTSTSALTDTQQQQTRPGGLTFPFTFALHLFNRDLEATQLNDLTLPWHGGFNLHIAKASLQIKAALADVFSVDSLIASNLILTDAGLQSISFEITSLKLANDTVTFERVGGEWVKGSGILLEGTKGKINALNNGIDLDLIKLTLDETGKFESAALEISSPKTLNIVDNAFRVKNANFAGSVNSSGGISLAFSGDPMIELNGMDIVNAKKMTIAYNRSGGAGDFIVRATTLSLGYGKLSLLIIEPQYKSGQLKANEATLGYGGKTEQSKQDSDWLSEHSRNKSFSWSDALALALTATFSVPKLEITSKGLSMGDPTVAQIALSMLGMRANLDFKKKRGSLQGKFNYEKELTLLSLPIPIVPGLEAFVDIRGNAALAAGLNATLAKIDPRQAPWVASANARLNGSLGLTIVAGAQVGSQLAIALAAGLYAKATATLKAQAGISGQLQFDHHTIEKVEGQPLLIRYDFSPVVTSSVGIQISAKAFYVYEKVLYQREFGRWVLGEYNLSGELRWDGKSWTGQHNKGGFASGKLNAPGAKDVAVNLKESREIQLKAGTAIVGSAELRKALVQEVIDEYLRKDEEVCASLDSSFIELSSLQHSHSALKRKIFSSLRFQGDLSILENEIIQAREKVEVLRKQYREVQLVLVKTKDVVLGVADERLDLGQENLAGQLEKLHRDNAKVESFRSTVKKQNEKIDKIKTLEKGIRDDGNEGLR